MSCVSISNGTLFSQAVWMTLVLWSDWDSAFWVGEENWAFRDIWRQVIWCLEPACDAFWVGISPLEMRDDKSWHYVWFSLMLWQAGSDLTELRSYLLRSQSYFLVLCRQPSIGLVKKRERKNKETKKGIVVRFLSVSSNSMSIYTLQSRISMHFHIHVFSGGRWTLLLH